ncbi:hypothetical protein MMB17_05345 [Methylobacterium organophilum]|uniref:hypothetical protein n=1 Tax=Methylobacterium organophilum TaxID=410 RepID=UPI001F135F02|nr:hypothetical protein [Methylobacterium organophilum]UMY18748.1 hypothetical protein MMB17_05345 [Methylobacterium organophilum]
MIARTSSMVALAGALMIGFSAAGQAAPGQADRSPSKVAEASPVKPVSVGEAEEEATNCMKPRKRLWIEGEGWVVRRVTICR